MFRSWTTGIMVVGICGAIGSPAALAQRRAESEKMTSGEEVQLRMQIQMLQARLRELEAKLQQERRPSARPARPAQLKDQGAGGRGDEGSPRRGRGGRGNPPPRDGNPTGPGGGFGDRSGFGPGGPGGPPGGFVRGGAGGRGRGAIGGGGMGAGGVMNPSAMFDRLSGGKDVLVRSELEEPQQRLFDRIAQRMNIKNGRITRGQWNEYYQQRRGQRFGGTGAPPRPPEGPGSSFQRFIGMAMGLRVEWNADNRIRVGSRAPIEIDWHTEGWVRVAPAR